MKNLRPYMFAFCTIAVLSVFAFTAKENDIVGNWIATELENSTIKIYKAKNGYFYGKVIASDKKDWIGKLVIQEVEYKSKKNEWVGQVHSLKRKMKIDAVITLEAPTKLKLVGTKFFMTKTFYWDKEQQK